MSKQTTHVVAAYPFKSWAYDADSNPYLLSSSTIIPASENVTLNLSLQIQRRDAAPPQISFEASGNLDDIPQTLGNYTGDEELRIRDLPELAIRGWFVEFSNVRS